LAGDVITIFTVGVAWRTRTLFFHTLIRKGT